LGKKIKRGAKTFITAASQALKATASCIGLQHQAENQDRF